MSGKIFRRSRAANSVVSGPTLFFSIISQWVLSVAMDTSVLIHSAYIHYASTLMLHIKFDENWPAGLRDIQVRKCKIFAIHGLQSE